MTKISGLGTTIICDDDGGTPRTISNDVNNYDFSTPYNDSDITGVDKSAMERLLLLADLTGTLNTTFNPATNEGHETLSGDLRVARTLSVAVGGVTMAAEVLFTDYKLTRSANGELKGQHPYSLQDGTVPAWT